MQLMLIDGRFRRVLNVTVKGDTAEVNVVIGFRELNSRSAKSPGAGWRPVPGQKRAWTKNEVRTETRFVNPREILTVEDWPTGMEKYKADRAPYIEILTPLVRSGVDAAGAIGTRQAPDIKIHVVESRLKDCGLVMPTKSEFDDLVKHIWEQNHRAAPRRVTNSAITNSPPKVVVAPVDPPPKAVVTPVDQPMRDDQPAPVDSPAPVDQPMRDDQPAPVDSPAPVDQPTQDDLSEPVDLPVQVDLVAELKKKTIRKK